MSWWWDRRVLGRLVAVVGLSLTLIFVGASPADASKPHVRVFGGGKPKEVVLQSHVALRVSATTIAIASGRHIRFTVELGRSVAHGVLTLTLPSVWFEHSPLSGLPFATQAVALHSDQHGRVARSGNQVRFDLRNAKPADHPAFQIRDDGIPAKNYIIRYTWKSSHRHIQRGRIRILVVKNPQELEHDPGHTSKDPQQARAAAQLAEPGRSHNVSNEANAPINEPTITVAPSHPNVLVLATNSTRRGVLLWRSVDSGTHWSGPIHLPSATRESTGITRLDPNSDPVLRAGDNQIWFSGVGKGEPGRVLVNHAFPGSGTEFQRLNVALPVPNHFPNPDHPGIALDTSKGATKGTVYVAWGADSDFRLNSNPRVLISFCRPHHFDIATQRHISGPAVCDEPDHWSKPVLLGNIAGMGSPGVPSIAVGPDGKVFVVWSDDSANNSVIGSSCDAARSDCATRGAWHSSEIAVLNNNEQPLPVNCPTPAQPGGRVGADPQIAVGQAGVNTQRVYVAWSDAQQTGVQNDHEVCTTSPRGKHWQEFVSSAVDRLPGTPLPEAERDLARRVPHEYSDAVGTALGPVNHRDFYQWGGAITTDLTTGDATASFYSTAPDESQKTAEYLVQSLAPSPAGSTRPVAGAIRAVSSHRSDFSNTQPHSFWGDYGDYSGITSIKGITYPAWIQSSQQIDAEHKGGNVYVFGPGVLPPFEPPHGILREPIIPRR